MPFSVLTTGFGEKWPTEISGAAEEKRGVVIAYSGFFPGRGFFHHLSRIECYFQFLKSAGYSVNHIPFVYSEENVAFRKELFFKTKGWGKNMKEHYADLELVMNDFMRKENPEILFNKESAVRKEIKMGRKDYDELLKKSFRIEKHLPFFHKVVLNFDESTRLLFVLVSVAAFAVHWPLRGVIASVLGVQVLAWLFIIKTTQKHLNERKIYVSSLLYDCIIPWIKMFYREKSTSQGYKKRWRKKP